MSNHTNQQVREQFDHVMVPNYAPSSMVPDRGLGSRVWDVEGKEYIDLTAGIAVCALGHCHPELVAALTQQANKFWHLSNVFTNEPAIELAETLCKLTFADRVFFANSGGEANEAALKLARKSASTNFSAEKCEIISFVNSFHGRTFFTVSVGGQAKYTEGFGPLPEGITHVEYNNIDALKAAISPRTCAVIMEPIMAEGGIITAQPEFVKAVRQLCDANEALLIFDEVQTGMGRTGDLYAYQGFAVTPDIMTSAKALGNGFPISAMLSTEKIAAAFAVGSHGSTYGGNPIACVVAKKAVEIISDPQTLQGVKNAREKILAGLEKINNQYNIFSEFRGLGLLIGCALTEQWQGKAKQFLNASIEEGLMLLMAGPDVIRIAPSLLISDEDIALGLERFSRAIDSVLKS